jgi:hypothetical protein
MFDRRRAALKRHENKLLSESVGSAISSHHFVKTEDISKKFAASTNSFPHRYPVDRLHTIQPI